MPTTVKDIARRAGVSHSTVSRALHHSSLISAETTGRIEQLASEMGYSPSAAARTLKTRRSLVLGVVLSSIEDPFFSEILQGIEEEVQGSGYSLFIAAAHRNPQREQEIVRAMVEHRVDGVIICSTSFSTEQSGQLLQFGLPLVVVNNQAVEDFRYSIYHDDLDGSRQITKHLIELGHHRIAYIGNSLAGRSSLDRLDGFRREMNAHALAVPAEYVIEAAGGRPPEGAAVLDHFLALPKRPTALICYNDMLALGVLKGLHQSGLDVPRDISVAGFDNIVFSAYTQPPLTTFDQPKRLMGGEAAHLLLGLLEPAAGDQGPVQKNVRVIKGSLLVRQSTAPPPATG